MPFVSTFTKVGLCISCQQEFLCNDKEFCKKCWQSRRTRIWREANAEKVKEYGKKFGQSRKFKTWKQARMNANRAKLVQIKNVPCADCGCIFHHSAMDFDHLPETIKKFTISTCMTHSWKTIMTEVEKCEIVCSNCHRVRTWNRRHPEDIVLVENIEKEIDMITEM